LRLEKKRIRWEEEQTGLILFVLYLLGTAAMADAAEGALVAVAKLDGGGMVVWWWTVALE
jgi:hypothetical protein